MTIAAEGEPCYIGAMRYRDGNPEFPLTRLSDIDPHDREMVGLAELIFTVAIRLTFIPRDTRDADRLCEYFTSLSDYQHNRAEIDAICAFIRSMHLASTDISETTYEAKDGFGNPVDKFD